MYLPHHPLILINDDLFQVQNLLFAVVYRVNNVVHIILKAKPHIPSKQFLPNLLLLGISSIRDGAGGGDTAPHGHLGVFVDAAVILDFAFDVVFFY